MDEAVRREVLRPEGQLGAQHRVLDVVDDDSEMAGEEVAPGLVEERRIGRRGRDTRWSRHARTLDEPGRGAPRGGSRTYARSVVIVVPFRAGGKSRLPAELRADVALAMLGDVVEAAVAVGDVRVVSGDPAGRLVAVELGAALVDDPGGGPGRGRRGRPCRGRGLCLVVNADVPRVRPSDLSALAVPARLGAVAIVEARDGTTNALGLPYAEVFQPLYGPRSAAQFRAHAVALALPFEDLTLRNLVEDVDTIDDLERVGLRAGSRTRASLGAITR